MCRNLLRIPFEPWRLGLELEPRGCPRSVGCQRQGLRLGRTRAAKWGNGPGGGRAEPSPSWAAAAIPSFLCKMGVLGTAPNSPQNNQTAEIGMENLGKQKQLNQGWVKNKAQRVWAVIPRLLWCLGIHMGTPGAEAGSVSPSVPSSFLCLSPALPLLPCLPPPNFSCHHKLSCSLQPHASGGFGFQSCPSSAQLRSGAPGLLVQLPMCQPK